MRRSAHDPTTKEVTLLHQKIQTYYGDAGDEHHRYRSWEHCYNYFRRARQDSLVANCDHAALQLAFYLASWGMYRGSSFLLRHAFTVHRGVIDLIAQPRFTSLWETDFGANETDCEFIPTIRELINGIKESYRPFAPASGSAQPTDTLVTKIVLGTFGCLPACDRYFIDGFKSEGFKYSRLDDDFVVCLRTYCRANLTELRKEQAAIQECGGVRYPLMKLVDMYFWQIGYEQDTKQSK
jgi:hypothetical protein